jgi:pimeloyl-ACP methyl ester carboxylesterase
VGATFQLYIAPQGQVAARVTRTTPHRLLTPTGPVQLQEYDLVFETAGAPFAVEVWIDGRGRLARLAIPASWLVVIRDDISSVMTREETITRPGDQEVFIPGNGFSMAATLSTPTGAMAKAPAVVLVGAAGRQDRDEMTSEVPVFGYIANALADAGFLVVRYDKRGVGRSGGRIESATLADYADDALRIVKWLRDRKDVDQNRIGMVGFREGGALALLAAAREKKVAAVALVSAPGQTGRELTLLQQQQILARSDEPDEDKQAKIALQQRVIDAALEGEGWGDVPPEVRRQADTAYFRSWLAFDPAAVMKKLKQPLLIVAGAEDQQVPPAQADRLEALGRARNKLPETATTKVIVPGVNHALVAGGNGEAAPAGTAVSPAVTSAIAEWMKGALPEGR